MSTEQKPKQLEPGYWYESEDCDRYAKAIIRELGGLQEGKDYLVKKTTEEDGKQWHVLITGSVSGQTNAAAHEMRIDHHLDYDRHPNVSIQILEHIIQNSQKFGQMANSHEVLVSACKDLNIESPESLKSVSKILDETATKKIPAEREKYIKDEMKKLKEEQKQNRTAPAVDIFSDIEDLLKDDQTHNFKVLFDCNLGAYPDTSTGIRTAGAHWIPVEVQIIKEANGQCVINIIDYNYAEGMGQDNLNKITAAIKKRFTELSLTVPTRINLQSAGKSLQSDGSSCGPIACEVLNLRAAGKPVPTEAYPAGVQTLRKAQLGATGGSVIFSDENPPKSSNPKSKWFGEHLRRVKEVYKKKFGTEPKKGKDDSVVFEHKESKIEILPDETCITGKNDNETLQKALEAMIQDKKNNGVSGSITIYVETNPKNKAIEDGLIKHGKTLGVTVKTKGQALLEDEPAPKPRNSLGRT